MRMVNCALVVGMLQASECLAQGPDTLSLRMTPMAMVTDSATEAMPASHRSAETNVDQPVSVVYCPRPSHPRALWDYGFGGHVEMVFVVDTLGLAEVHDLVISEASHIGFVPAARRAVAKCRFQPARKAGRPVRRLVKQRAVFRVQTPEPVR